jgi:hypothetical protein
MATGMSEKLRLPPTMRYAGAGYRESSAPVTQNAHVRQFVTHLKRDLQGDGRKERQQKSCFESLQEKPWRSHADGCER